MSIWLSMALYTFCAGMGLSAKFAARVMGGAYPCRSGCWKASLQSASNSISKMLSLSGSNVWSEATHYRHDWHPKVSAVKLSGVASRYDPDTYNNTGPFPVLIYMDDGLPSTHCDTDTLVEVTLGIL